MEGLTDDQLLILFLLHQLSISESAGANDMQSKLNKNRGKKRKISVQSGDWQPFVAAVKSDRSAVQSTLLWPGPELDSYGTNSDIYFETKQQRKRTTYSKLAHSFCLTKHLISVSNMSVVEDMKDLYDQLFPTLSVTSPGLIAHSIAFQ